MTTPHTPWYVYMVRCADDTLYTGITTDVARRIAEHNGVGKEGARYTRSRRPVVLLHSEELAGRAAAASREAAIKRLTRPQKLALLECRAGDSTPLPNPLPEGEGAVSQHDKVASE